MMYIYLVNEEASYLNNNGEVTFSVCTTHKAFKHKIDAVEYGKMVKQYNRENQIEGIKREVSIKKVELA